MLLAEPRRTLLVVDDDVAILRVFRRIFERNGYFVATAETGKEAMEKLEARGYDAALVELGLPDMDGTTLLSLICKRTENGEDRANGNALLRERL